ncbi:hypothetical protein [Nocardia sp. NPDC004711]
MTSYEAIQEAAEIPDFYESVTRVKELAARTISDADKNVRVFSTENFNHSYFPDFVLRWPGRERFVFLRTSSYAEEIEEDVVNLAGKHPIFMQLSEFRPYGDDPSPRRALDALSAAARSTKSLVTSVPAIELLDGPRSERTGRILSSYVMRGGRGLVEDDAAPALAERVETGFNGALGADRAPTAAALEVLEGLLDPPTNAEFTHLLEAAWISGGGSALDFPGSITTIGENLSATLLAQLLDIVPENIEEFWNQVGNAITIDSFDNMDLVGSQPRLQLIMRTAIGKLLAKRCSIRRTYRSDQEFDPFMWQVYNGILSLRGGGFQAWMGKVPSGLEGEHSVDDLPTLTKVSTRSENAGLTLTEIGVRDAQELSVRFSSSDGRDIATSELIHRVSDSLGTSVKVDSVTARVNGKALRVDLEAGFASVNTTALVDLSDLVWNAWNILAETDSEDVRVELRNVLAVENYEGISSSDVMRELPAMPTNALDAPTMKALPSADGDQIDE